MAQPFIGEIRMFAGSFAPAGWAFCSGQQIPISENNALYALIGTTYGGDGQQNFNLPNLQGRIPIHMGQGPDGTSYVQGESAGTETVTLTTQQIPNHTHPGLASSTGQVQSPNNAVLATATSTQTGIRIYNTTTPDTPLHGSAISAAGGSQPHENCQPFLCISFIISLYGIYPPPP
ncbi:MAG TPA: tail fiber protein [Allosphingosinicella sp.]|jgi:microcystin-dependent protein